MIETDIFIESNFNELINKKIEENMNLVQGNIEKDYISILNQYFKEQLITPYSNITNLKTNEMIETIRNEREMLKSKIDNLFTIEPDDVLNDINLKINNTIYSIEEYNSHLNTFTISEDLINYLNSYGETTIKLIYESLFNLLNNQTKNTILNIEENYKNYEQYLNLRDYIEQSNKIYLIFETNYIDKIKENINSYGINNYPEHLENEIDRHNERNRRRLSRLLSDEEIEIINNEKIADKILDDIFKILLTSLIIQKHI